MAKSFRSSEGEVRQVISRLIAAGARFWTEGERLRFSGPPGLLTDQDDTFIGEHKADALRVVSEWERSLDWLDWPLQREGCYTLDGDACGACGCIN